jgi:hypothetical protein
MRPVLFCLLTTTALALAETPALYFDGPEIVKLDWNTSSPRSADFNGDGLTDLAIVNSTRARIEFLLQRKEGVQPGEAEKLHELTAGIPSWRFRVLKNGRSPSAVRPWR